jgi:hypothetical protein
MPKSCPPTCRSFCAVSPNASGMLHLNSLPFDVSKNSTAILLLSAKLFMFPRFVPEGELRVFIWLPRLPLPIRLPGCKRLLLFTSAYDHHFR